MTLASATIQISGYKTFLFSLFSKEFVKVTPMCFFFLFLVIIMKAAISVPTIFQLLYIK